MRFYKLITGKLGKKIFDIHPKNVFNFRHEFFVEAVNDESIVLDIACGMGLISYKVSFKAKQVIGIDNDILSIKICRQRFKRENITYHYANLYEMDYLNLKKKTGFNVVILSHILEHVKDVPKLLKRINSEELLICVPSQENWETQLMKYLKLPYMKDSGHFREYSRRRLIKSLEKAGYRPTYLGFNSEGEINCKASIVR